MGLFGKVKKVARRAARGAAKDFMRTASRGASKTPNARALAKVLNRANPVRGVRRVTKTLRTTRKR